MKQLLKKMRSDSRAFTLIEMTVVLFIISILSLLIIPNVTALHGTIDDKGTEALVDVIETQAQFYKLEEGQVAESLDVLQTEGLLTAQQVEEARERGITLSGGVVIVE